MKDCNEISDATKVLQTNNNEPAMTFADLDPVFPEGKSLNGGLADDSAAMGDYKRAMTSEVVAPSKLLDGGDSAVNI